MNNDNSQHSNTRKPKKAKLFSKSFKSPGVIIFVLLFAAIGTYLIFSSFAASNQEPIRISAGSTSDVTVGGKTWKAETGYFTGGKTYSIANNIDIANTTDDALFRTSRSGTNGGSFSYNVNGLANGTYTVKLYLAELWNDQWGTNCATGRRTFSVTGNSTPILTNFDLFTAAGGCRTAYITPGTNVTVSNGTLVLNFTRGNSGSDPNPTVNAIEVIPVDISPPTDNPPTVSLATTSTNVTQGSNVTLSATASDDNGVSKVDFYDGSTLLGTDSSSPYTYSWTTSTATLTGAHSLTARATDTAGLSTTSSAVSVTVNAASTPPPTSTNLALNRLATASSTHNSAGQPSNVFDGSTTTRWSSSYSEPQWIQVDLGSHYSISGVKLNWEAAYGRAYAIQVSNDGTNWTTIYSTSTGDGGTDNLANLSGSGRYVRMNGTTRAAVNGVQYGFSLWEMEVYGTAIAPPPADTEAPSVPSGLTAVANSGSQVQLNWNRSTDNVNVTKYRIYRNGGNEPIANLTTNSYMDASGLTQYTDYTYTVDACDAANNCSVKSAPLTVKTKDTNPPVQPAGLTANGISSSAINVTWNASTDAETGLNGYSVYRNGTKVANNIASTSFSDTGLTASTTYSYTVEACDKATPANCILSAVASGTTQVGADTTAPTVPGNFRATVNSSTQVTLNWNASTDAESPTGITYTVTRNGTPVATNITSLSYVNSGLTASTTYQYAVTAKNSVNLVSTASTVSATTNAAPDSSAPTVPANLNGTAISTTQINLTWSASTDTGGSGLSGYNVYRNGTKINTNLVTSTSYGDTGLTANTAYSYTVNAVDGAGNASVQSPAKSVTTQNTAPPPTGGGCSNFANPGSLSSVSSALNSTPNGGVLCLRGGTYTGSGVTLSGSKTVKSAPGETAVIDAAGQSIGKTSDVLTLGSNLIFRDIEIKNSSGRALSITGSNTRVVNNRIYDIQYNGILDAGTNNIIEDNEVFRTVLSNRNAVLGGSGWAEAINTWGATNSIIRNNEIYDSWGEGIDYINSNGGVAEGNLVYRNYSVQIYLDGSSNVTVRNNKLGANIAGANRAVTGVLVASEGGGGVSGNVVTGNYFTVTPYYSTWNVPASAVTFSNNFRCDANYANCVGL